MQRTVPSLLCLAAFACGAPAPAASAPTPAEAIAEAPERCEPTSDPDVALAVYGYAVSWDELHAIARLVGTDPSENGSGREALVIRGALERELWIHEAERRGLTASVAETMRRVRQDQVVFLSAPLDAPLDYPHGALTRDLSGPNGFDESALIRLVRALGTTMPVFAQWQAREELAVRARRRLVEDVGVDEDAVFEAYAASHDTATVREVSFHARSFEPPEVDPEALARWSADHEAEIAATMTRERHRYTDLPEQRRARHILIQVAPDAPEPERAEAQARAEELLRQARQPGASFAALARAHSEDPSSAARGGELGWSPRGRLVEPFEEALFAARRPGVIRRVVSTRFGLHVLALTGIREGDVPDDAVRTEIAERLFRDAVGPARARAAAEALLAAWRGGAELEPLVAAVAAEQGGARYGPMVTERLVRRPPPPEPRATPPAPSEPASPDRLSPSQLEELIRRLRGEAPALPEVTAALEMQPGDFSPAPFANGPDWVVFQVTERATPRREDLDAETRASIEARLLEAGRRERLLELGVELRAAADAAGCLWMTDDPVEAARTRLRAR